jgi:ribosomal silencing factor RsfS
MHTACENFNKNYKKFKDDEDAFAKNHGKKSEKWCAIDCGNIVIHLFQKEYRNLYDLESLWTVGYEYDEKYNEIITKQNEILSKIESLEVK